MTTEDARAGITAYRKYLAVRNHFKTDYDFFKYGGVVNVKDETYLKRKDKIFFQKALRDHRGELTDLFVANFVAGNEYVRDAVSEKGKKALAEWKKRAGAPIYHVQEDLSKILSRCGGELSTALKDTGHPLVLRMWMRGEIYIVTVCVLDDLTGFLSNLPDDPVSDEYKKKARKTAPFIKFDRQEMARILKEDTEEWNT